MKTRNVYCQIATRLLDYDMIKDYFSLVLSKNWRSLNSSLGFFS